MIEAVLIAQGDELTTGQTVDTNSNWLAGQLWDLGVPVRRVITAPDRIDDLTEVVAQAAALAPIVICTGGLGPTRDDLTAEAVARAFGKPLAAHAEALGWIEAIYARWGRTMSESNRKQAVFPTGAVPLPNTRGTAPGFTLHAGGADLYFMPGVPHEMRAMFHKQVSPHIRGRHEIHPPVRHIIRVVGIPESELEERMRGLVSPGLSIGFRANAPEIQVKLVFQATTDPADRQAALKDALERIGPKAFGVDSGDLAEVVGELLAARGETVALAESCTAGRLAAWVGGVSGASRYLLEGAVVYSDAAKIRTCNVPADLIEAEGAVSEAVAIALATGIATRASATWGVGITGIAGPTGGTPDKPVGTVHVAISGPGGVTHRKLRMPGDRERVTRFSAAAALILLHRRLKDASTAT